VEVGVFSVKIKEDVRSGLLQMRLKISEERRREARRGVVARLYSDLCAFPKILSFASKEQEIDLWSLNSMLAKEGRLLLPRLVDAIHMSAFMVRDLALDLVMHPKWGFLEPNPDRCPAVTSEHIGCVLVPGVGFDAYHQRLGYGKGFYDRFLAKLHCPFYGIGFYEQYLSSPIPAQPHDIPLSKIYFF